MHKSEFRTIDGQTLSVSIRPEFFESTRQHAIDQRTPTAYVAPVSHVFREPIDTMERCVVIALPNVASKAVDCSATSVTPQVRTRSVGTPVACALLANGQVAIHADALNEVHPLNGARFNVLWMFEDNCTFVHCPYDEEAEEWFSATAMVADGHRHETDYGAHEADENTRERHVIEVFNYFKIDVAG